MKFMPLYIDEYPDSTLLLEEPKPAHLAQVLIWLLSILLIYELEMFFTSQG